VQQPQYDGSKAAEAISTIASKVLASAALRKSFAADPLGTLERAGIDIRAIPERILDTLAELSYEELGVVARVNQTLIESGIAAEPVGEPRIIF
jgi:hypothetical protein